MPITYSKSDLHKHRNPPSFENKVTHYHSDGSGRDNYILVNEGGRTNNYTSKNATEFLFKNSLRSY